MSKKKDKGVCFVIAPIGEPDPAIRERSDRVFQYVITPPVEELGYESIRADHISEPGLITSQIIQHIVDAPLVIADLACRNPNVFYELAIRHAIRKPLAQVIEMGERIPFDVANMRTISVDHRDLKSVDEAKQEITRQIEALEAKPTEIETPISVALDLQTLRRSDDPKDRQLADILSAVSDLRSAFTSIQAQLDSLIGATRLPRGLIFGDPSLSESLGLSALLDVEPVGYSTLSHSDLVRRYQELAKLRDGAGGRVFAREMLRIQGELLKREKPLEISVGKPITDEPEAE